MNNKNSDILICGHSIEEYENMVEKFHGTKAPGLIIGGFMVDLAHKNLPEGELYDVICESMKCLPDAVQILTPCSIGNGWLKILKIGRFALTFYNKYTGSGIRVYLDTEKLKNYSEVYNWFFKITPKQEQDDKALMREIYEAGTGILSIQKVKVDPEMSKKKKGTKIGVCSKCGEAYPLSEGGICKVCSREITYYEQ
ncbi:MAG: formylmethanofuran dehydrogenase subunit E family protein [bacterium]|nr:formylmethanofuran dehydrogenase subunit E family protein [bacterium]